MPRKRAHHGVPDWLEQRSVLNDPTGVIDPRTAWGANQLETLTWLRRNGLDAQDYEPLCEAYDRARAAGHDPEQALELALAECRT